LDEETTAKKMIKKPFSFPKVFLCANIFLSRNILLLFRKNQNQTFCKNQM